MTESIGQSAEEECAETEISDPLANLAIVVRVDSMSTLGHVDADQHLRNDSAFGRSPQRMSLSGNGLQRNEIPYILLPG